MFKISKILLHETLKTVEPSLAKVLARVLKLRWRIGG